MGNGIQFVGFKEAATRQFFNTPIGMIAEMPGEIKQGWQALKEGDFGTIFDLYKENVKDTLLWPYYATSIGLIDSCFDIVKDEEQ